MIKKILLGIVAVSILFVPLYHFAFCEGEIYQFNGAYIKYNFKNSDISTVEYRIKRISGENMIVLRIIHYENGTWENKIYKDSVKNPNYFPVIPRESIGDKRIRFQNRSFYFKSRGNLEIRGKEYHTLEYICGGIDRLMTIFIDSSTGIILNASEFLTISLHGKYLWIAEIEDTNIHERNCIPEIIGISIFVISLAVLFYLVIRDRGGKQ